MSIFGMIIFIAWVGICLGAGRVYFLFGFWAFVVAVAASLRVAGEVALRAGRGEPLGQARRGLLHASSGVVVTVITGAGLFGLMTPLTAVGFFLQWVDTWTGFTSMPPREARSIVVSLVVTGIVLGSLVLALGVGSGTLLVVSKRLWPVAPDPIRGCLELLRPLGVAGLLLVVGSGIVARLQADDHARRISRVAGWAEAARRERAAKLRLAKEVERGPGVEAAARLRDEADHAGKVVRAEEDRVAELRAEWQSSWVSWRWLPWPSAVAALVLVALLVRWVRRPGDVPTTAVQATWLDRLPSHRVLDQTDINPYPRGAGTATDPVHAEAREAPTRSWPAYSPPPASYAAPSRPLDRS